MTRDLAIVTRVQKIEPIPNYDRVVKATIENYPVIVQKDQFKEGDLCVYVREDSLLPVKPEFEFLRKNSYSKLYNGFRIRNMKMCGMYSSGIAFSLSILPEGFQPEEGDDVTDLLEVRKYDPEELQEMVQVQNKVKNQILLFLMRFKWFRKLYAKLFGKKVRQYPETVQKSDETNIEKLFNSYKTQRPDEEFYVTEKMEGSAGAWMLYGKRRKYLVFSHNAICSSKDNNTWAKVGRMYNLEKILRSEKRNLCIQGEVCGPNIQKNIYGFDDLRLFVYKVTDVDTGEALNYRDLVNFCSKHDLDMVPVLYENRLLLDTLDDMLKDCEGKSVLADVPREGLVWRSMIDQNIGFKCKSRAYQLWFAGNKETL